VLEEQQREQQTIWFIYNHRQIQREINTREISTSQHTSAPSQTSSLFDDLMTGQARRRA